jgi:ABC-type maltose transport system permease subunit
MVDEQGRDLFVFAAALVLAVGPIICLFSGYRRFFIPGMGKAAGT